MPVDNDLIMGSNSLNTHQNMFNLRWEHINTADNQHIVGTAGYFFHSYQCPAAFARFIDQPGNIFCPVSDNGKGFLGQRCEHQFALFSGGQHFAGIRIDDLRQEMILKNMHPTGGFQTFHGNTGTNYFR